MPRNKALTKIIPKPKIEIPTSLNILFWLSLILLIILGGVFFFLQNQVSNLETRKGELERQLSSQPQKEIEKRLVEISEKMEDFSEFFQEHKISSKFFEFLKDSCHQKVRLTSLYLNNKDFRVELSGKTEDFQTLGQQILIFQNREEVKDVKVSDVVLDREGAVNFSLTFNFSEDLIKK